MTFRLVSVLMVPIWYLRFLRYLKGLSDGEAENDRAERGGDKGAGVGPSRLLGRGQSWLRPTGVFWRAQGMDRNVPARQCEAPPYTRNLSHHLSGRGAREGWASAPCRPVRRYRPGDCEKDGTGRRELR